jgi:paraquat-inducible protein A
VHDASLLSGTVALLVEGPMLVGLIVGVCSLVMPVIKLLVIVALTQDATANSARVRGLAHTLIETAGRWGLLDVMLVAVLLATLKLKGLVEIHAGPGALAFTLCVALNLAASACLDPRDFWEETTT